MTTNATADRAKRGKCSGCGKRESVDQYLANVDLQDSEQYAMEVKVRTDNCYGQLGCYPGCDCIWVKRRETFPSLDAIEEFFEKMIKGETEDYQYHVLMKRDAPGAPYKNFGSTSPIRESAKRKVDAERKKSSSTSSKRAKKK